MFRVDRVPRMLCDADFKTTIFRRIEAASEELLIVSHEKTATIYHD